MYTYGGRVKEEKPGRFLTTLWYVKSDFKDDGLTTFITFIRICFYYKCSNFLLNLTYPLLKSFGDFRSKRYSLVLLFVGRGISSTYTDSPNHRTRNNSKGL